MVDQAGKRLATAAVPALPVPVDFVRKFAGVILRIPAGVSLQGAAVVIESGAPEITRANNRVGL